LEQPKNPDTCNVFAIYKLLASDPQIAEMRNNYIKGGYGYGHAKQALFELIIQKFAKQRDLYNHYINSPQELDAKLKTGADKARVIARAVLKRARQKLGY